MKRIVTLLLVLSTVSIFASAVDQGLWSKAQDISRDFAWKRKKVLTAEDKTILVRGAEEILKSLPPTPDRRAESTVKDAYYCFYLAGDRDKALKTAEKYHKIYDESMRFVYLLELNRRKEYDKMYELGMPYVNSNAVYEQDFFKVACLLGCNDNKARQNEYIKNLEKHRIRLISVFFSAKSLAARLRFLNNSEFEKYIQDAVMEAFRKFTFPPKQQAELIKIFAIIDYRALHVCRDKQEFCRLVKAFWGKYPQLRQDYLSDIASDYISFKMYKEAEALYREQLASNKGMHIYSGLFMSLYLSKQYAKLLEEAIPVFDKPDSDHFTVRFGNMIVPSAIQLKKFDIAESYARKTYKKSIATMNKDYGARKKLLKQRLERASSASSKKSCERELQRNETAKVQYLLAREADYRKALCELSKAKGAVESAVEALEDWEKESFKIIEEHNDFDSREVTKLKHEIFAAKIRLMIELKKFEDAERILTQFENEPSDAYYQRRMKTSLKRELQEAKKRAAKTAGK